MNSFIPTNWDDIDYESYEKLVAAIIAGQLEHSEVNHIVEHDIQHPYEYGEKQIDVLVTDGDSEMDQKITLIDCKFHQDNIEQDVIASLAFYLDHSNADAAVVVAYKGFQKGAKNIARGRDDIRLFTVGEVTTEEQAKFPDPFEIDLTLTLSDHRHVVMITKGDPQDWQRLRDVATSSTELELLTLDGKSTGETLQEQIEANTKTGTGKISTEFDGEFVEIDGEYYEVLKAISQENPSGAISSTDVIDIADQFDIMLADPLAEEDTFDDENKDTRAKIFKSFDEIHQSLFQIESG